MRVLLVVTCLISCASLLGQIESRDRSLTQTLQGLERHKTDLDDTKRFDSRWALRSRHFVFGMPRLTDNRHDFKPEGYDKTQTGISVLVREGFVVAHFDLMGAPLFVCQRWTIEDLKRMKKESKIGRNWKVDLELPLYSQFGTSYNWNQTQMDRGHMARHEDLHAWGHDNVQHGTLMSNSAPQHKNVNQGKAWRDLENMIQEVVDKDDLEIKAIWSISGTLYRNKDLNGSPKDDFENVKRIGDGFGEPVATYKIIGWFDKSGFFQARGYLFEQDDHSKDLKTRLEKIDVIEERSGIDFFPLLKDHIEKIVEGKKYTTFWERN